MRMRLVLLVAAALSLAVAPVVDRALVEDGSNTTISAGASDGGQLLVLGLLTGETVRVRPAECIAGLCTRVVPDAGNEGLSTGDMESWRVQVCPPGSFSLGGCGDLELWTKDAMTGRWGDNVQKKLSVTKSGPICQSFSVERNSMSAGDVRFLYRANGVCVIGLDGGAAIVSVSGCKMGRKGGCAP